jgi:hypothetical protein
MNMTTGLLHRSKTGADHPTLPSAPDLVPPSVHPPESGNGMPWPERAKVLVALLIVATVVATVGAAIGLTSRDDGSTERLLRGRVASLTVERDNALGDVEEIDGELATLRQQLREALADNDNLTDSAVELEARIASLEAELATVQQRVTAVIAERDALADRFPMTFDASLGNAVVGDYDVSVSEMYCAGFTSCRKAPALDDLTIRKTPEGFLRLKVPGFVEGGLFRADGALHTVVDTNTAIPACAGTPRTARVAMTVVPGVYEIGDDGVLDVVNLRAVITVEAAATGNCPAGLAFYSAEVTPQA